MSLSRRLKEDAKRRNEEETAALEPTRVIDTYPYADVGQKASAISNTSCDLI